MVESLRAKIASHVGVLKRASSVSATSTPTKNLTVAMTTHSRRPSSIDVSSAALRDQASFSRSLCGIRMTEQPERYGRRIPTKLRDLGTR